MHIEGDILGGLFHEGRSGLGSMGGWHLHGSSSGRALNIRYAPSARGSAIRVQATPGSLRDGTASCRHVARPAASWTHGLVAHAWRVHALYSIESELSKEWIIRYLGSLGR